MVSKDNTSKATDTTPTATARGDHTTADNSTARGTANEAANAAARAEGEVPTTAKAVAADAPDPSPAVAEKQQKAKDWPVPGDEGFVHPDGTQQSIRQLEENKQAAADRVAAAEEANRLLADEAKATKKD